MPIVKETSSRLIKIQHPYEVISRDVVQSITNPIALAIHTYLLTKPDGWIVRKNEILSHFEGLGSDRYIAAMKHLAGLGLYSVSITRNDLGQIVDKAVIISATPEKPNNPQMGISGTENGDFRMLAYPNVGKSPRIEIQRLPIDTDKGLGERISGWDEWVEYRKAIKKTMTKPTVDKQVKFLLNRPPEQQLAIINQSIQNGWTGLFEVKTNGNTKNTINGVKDSRRLSGAERTRLAREAAYERQRLSRSPDMGGLEPN